MHYVFDEWMRRNNPSIPFERYADDVVCHCRTLDEAHTLKAALEQRMAHCSLVLHPQKTQIVYCRDGKRKRPFDVHQFDFLGYRFRPRCAKSRGGKLFLSFLPAISPKAAKAAKAIRQTVRGWRLHHRHTVKLAELAQEINPVLTGWLNYYGHFYRSALYTVFDTLDQYLVRWVQRKYKRLKHKTSRARQWMGRIRHQHPRLFSHWTLAQNGGR